MKQTHISVDAEALSSLVKKHLSHFYTRRIDCLDNLSLKDVLKRKNPYLFRAVGVHDVGELIRNLLLAYSSSSDETVFGNEFFEPLVRDLSKGKTADGEGVDVLVETTTQITAYAIKSGTSVFNSSSRRDQEQSFVKMRNRLYKTHKQFDAAVGYCYGRKGRRNNAAPFREVAGQEFWKEITGDPECYIKVIEAMRNYPDIHRMEFLQAWTRAVNRFSAEFMYNFMSQDGTINWPALLRYNSGQEVIPWKQVPAPETIQSKDFAQSSCMKESSYPYPDYDNPMVADAKVEAS